MSDPIRPVFRIAELRTGLARPGVVPGTIQDPDSDELGLVGTVVRLKILIGPDALAPDLQVMEQLHDIGFPPEMIASVLAEFDRMQAADASTPIDA